MKAYVTNVNHPSMSERENSSGRLLLRGIQRLRKPKLPNLRLAILYDMLYME